MRQAPLLRVESLSKHYHAKSGIIQKAVRIVKAVDNISFHIDHGETLGLVGESGCGKTTTGRLLLRLLDPTSGSMRIRHEGTEVDLGALQGEALRRYRRHIQMVFQDPYSSLNPRIRVRDLIAEPVLALEPEASADQVEERVRWIAGAVDLKLEQLNRFPHAFSGGQRQRICIARALVVKPRLVVCDEPVSALDVSVRAQIINLLKDLQSEFKLTYLFIAHDLAIVQNISNRVAVMYAGRIVEVAGTAALYERPTHPYTRALLQAIPIPDPRQRTVAEPLAIDASDGGAQGEGCPFRSRCPLAYERCGTETPQLREVAEGHQVACHVAEANRDRKLE